MTEADPRNAIGANSADGSNCPGRPIHVRAGNVAAQGSCVRTKVGAAWECSWTTILPAARSP